MANVAFPAAVSDVTSGMTAIAIPVALAAFLAWSALRDRSIRRRATRAGAWGAPAIRHAEGLRGERGILLVNDEGLGWAPEGSDPAGVVPWEDVAAMDLRGRGREGLGIPLVPLPTVQLGVQTRGGAARFVLPRGTLRPAHP